MPITSQAGDWTWARDFDDPVTHSVTVQVPNANSFAEIALYDVWVYDESFHSTLCTIDQMVSASGVENFDDDTVPMAFRRNVTSITFRVDAINAHVGARWMINFYT